MKQLYSLHNKNIALSGPNTEKRILIFFFKLKKKNNNFNRKKTLFVHFFSVLHTR